MAVHTVPPTETTLAAAMGAAGIRAFDFDLPMRVSLLANTFLRNQLLSRIAFACDAYINVTIQRALTVMREAQEAIGTDKWDSYQAFLAYVSGYAHSEELMAEAGMEVEPMRETIQKLFNVRTQIHNLLTTFEGPSYEVPLITEWMRNPRPRRDDVDTIRKLGAVIRMQATNLETGVIDPELEAELTNSYAEKRKIAKQDQLKWDKQRGDLAATMFEALNIRDDVHEIGYDGDNEEPFLDLSLQHQYKLLTGMKRYVPGVLMQMIDDRKITPEEHAGAVIESRPLLKAVIDALAHPRFASIHD